MEFTIVRGFGGLGLLRFRLLLLLLVGSTRSAGAAVVQVGALALAINRRGRRNAILWDLIIIGIAMGSAK